MNKNQIINAVIVFLLFLLNKYVFQMTEELSWIMAFGVVTLYEVGKNEKETR